MGPLSICYQSNNTFNYQAADRNDYFNDILGVLDSIPMQGDSVLGFGYVHKQDSNYPSTVNFFAHKIIPWLAKNGYRDLVLEILPLGGEIEGEISKFNKTGVIGEIMQRHIATADQTSFVMLLRNASRYGIRLHSGGVDLKNANSTSGCSDSQEECLKMARQEIQNNSKKKIEILRKQGARKIASFNGAAHNDVNPAPHNNDASFGNTINNFIEVDLVSMENLQGSYYRDLPLSEKGLLKAQVCSKKFKLINERKNSFLVIIPPINR